MSYEQCTSLQDTGVDSLPISFLDTNQQLQLSGMDMPAKSSEKEQQTDGSLDCKCGKGTFDCSIHPSTPEAWTLFMRDSLAKTLALLESRQAYLREPDQVFTEKSCASLAWYDQSSCSWKTYQQSLVTDWEPYSETWPRWGMTQGGSAYAHPMSGLSMSENDGSCLPTLTVNGNYNRKGLSKTSGDGLATALKKLPTLCARDWKDSGTSNAERNRNTPPLAVHAGGPLNPEWCEWFMGFPIGHTELKGLEIRKSRCKPQQLIACSEVSE